VILCGVDGSDEAARAARFAGELAVRTDKRLILLHAAPQPWIPTGSPEYYELMREHTDELPVRRHSSQPAIVADGSRNRTWSSRVQRSIDDEISSDSHSCRTLDGFAARRMGQ
jgi:hypothetical protein